jgi:UDP-N-acetylglucosamine acyltransferase
MPDISPQAIVDPSAELAEDVRVGPFSYVGPEVSLGPGCVVENNATLTGRTTLGRNNRVFPLAVIGADPGGAGRQGPASRCVIGDDNCFREHVTVVAGSDPPTRIGDDNLIMIGSYVGPSAQVGRHGIFPNFTQIGSGAVIEDYVRTSGFSAVGDGVRIGEYTLVAGYASITRDAPPYAIIWDNPFLVRGVNSENLRRCGFADTDIRALKAAFRALFNGGSDRPAGDAMTRLQNQSDVNPYVRRLVDYLAPRVRAGEAHA